MIKLKFQETVELMKAIPRRMVEGVEKPVYTIESEMDCPITGTRIVALFNDPRMPILYYDTDHEAWLLTHTLTNFSWKYPMRCFKGSLKKMSDVKNPNAVKGMPFGYKHIDRETLLISCLEIRNPERIVPSCITLDAWAVKMFFPQFDKALMKVLFRYLDQDKIDLACKLSGWFKCDFGWVYNELVINERDYQDMPEYLWRIMVTRADENVVYPMNLYTPTLTGIEVVKPKKQTFYESLKEYFCSHHGWKWLLNERGHTRLVKRARCLKAVAAYANMCSQIPNLKKMTKSIAADLAYQLSTTTNSSKHDDPLILVFVQILRWINDGPGIKRRIAQLTQVGDWRHLLDYLLDTYRNRNFLLEIPREAQKLPGITHVRRYEQWNQDILNRRFTASRQALEHSWETYLKEYTRSTEKHTFRAEALTTGEQLQDESRKMHHCVYSYWSVCGADSRQIYRIFQDDKHVATVEIVNRLPYTYGDYTSNQSSTNPVILWSLSQCYGPCNQRTSDAIREFAAYLTQAYQETHNEKIGLYLQASA